MTSTLDKIRAKISGAFQGDYPEDFEDDYVELDPNAAEKTLKAKVLIRPFIIEDFSDIKPVLDSLRSGYTVALLNIRPLKDKDLVELKRVVNKLKKTTDAIEGDIAGFGEDWIVACPSFATVHRGGSDPNLSGE